MSFSCVAQAEKAHADAIWSAAWVDNETLVSGSVDETVKVWDVSVTGAADALGDEGFTNTSLKRVRTLDGHQLGAISVGVRTAAASAEGEGGGGGAPKATVAVSSLDCVIRLWDVASGEAAGTIDAGPVDAWTLAWSPDGATLASGSQSGKVNFWSAAKAAAGEGAAPPPAPAAPAAAGGEGEEGTAAAAAAAAANGALLRSVSISASFVMSVAYSPDGLTVAAGGHDGRVTLVDVASGKVRATLADHAGPVRSLSFSADGATLLSGSDDSHVNIYDVAAHRAPALITSLSGHSSWVLAVAARPDGGAFATCGADHTVKVWDMADRQCVHTFEEHHDQVWALAYSPDGRRLVSGGEDAALCVYDCGV
jgi:WD repeat-containing protein 61